MHTYIHTYVHTYIHTYIHTFNAKLSMFPERALVAEYCIPSIVFSGRMVPYKVMDIIIQIPVQVIELGGGLDLILSTSPWPEPHITLIQKAVVDTVSANVNV